MTPPSRKRALLVEDEFLILMLLEGMMRDLGYDVVATASSLDQGFAILRRGMPFDVAVLDVNLNGALSYQLADELRAAQVPVLFSTGYGRQGLHETYKSWPVVQKPYSEHELRIALLALQP